MQESFATLLASSLPLGWRDCYFTAHRHTRGSWKISKYETGSKAFSRTKEGELLFNVQGRSLSLMMLPWALLNLGYFSSSFNKGWMGSDAESPQESWQKLPQSVKGEIESSIFSLGA